MSLLPISGVDTLIYGSRDAGKTVSCSDPDFNEMMARAAGRLNLAEAMRGTKSPGKLLHAAIDIEGHLGSDGRHYLLDFSRAMPPEAPRPKAQRTKNEHLFRLLRPEFVINYNVPLCPDAFSNMIYFDPNRKQHEENIREATHFLIEHVIPRYAVQLVETVAEHDGRGAVDQFQLNQHLHASGINVRHLGHVASEVRKLNVPYAALTGRLVLVELCSRVLKVHLRNKLRATMELYRVPLEQPYLEVAVEFLNTVFGTSVASEEFWDTTVRKDVLDKFGVFALPGHGMLSLRKTVMQAKLSVSGKLPGCKFLFLHLQKQLGFVVSPDLQHKIHRHPEKLFSSFSPFQQFHFIELGQHVKSFDIVTLCQANYLLVRGIATKDPHDAVKILEEAEGNFRDLLAASPNNAVTIRQYAICLFYFAMNQEKANLQSAERAGLLLDADLLRNPKMLLSLKMFERAVELSPNDKSAHLSFAKALVAFGADMRAEDHFVRAVEIDPSYIPALRDYADFLSSAGREQLASDFRERTRRVMHANLSRAFNPEPH